MTNHPSSQNPWLSSVQLTPCLHFRSLRSVYSFLQSRKLLFAIRDALTKSQLFFWPCDSRLLISMNDADWFRWSMMIDFDDRHNHWFRWLIPMNYDDRFRWTVMHHRSLSQRASPQTKIATVIGPTPEAASMPQAGGVDVDELAIASTNIRPVHFPSLSRPRPIRILSILSRPAPAHRTTRKRKERWTKRARCDRTTLKHDCRFTHIGISTS